MTEKEKQEIIELVHKTLRGFFGPFPEGELGARPLTQTEKTLLEVNKVLCEKIKEMPTADNDRPHGTWIEDIRSMICKVNDYYGYTDSMHMFKVLFDQKYHGWVKDLKEGEAE